MRGDKRQRSRNHQGSAKPLRGASEYQLNRIRRKRAGERGHRKQPDAEREKPPAIGSWVTYRFNGTNASGLPRFARFVRVREDR